MTLKSGESIPAAETKETVKTDSALDKPTAEAMLKAYARFQRGQPGILVAGRPCKQRGLTEGNRKSGITTQCAVRMSIALGMTVNGFTLTNADAEHTHGADNSACDMHPDLNYPHNTGAERLFKYLKKIWTFTEYRRTGRSGLDTDAVFQAVRGKNGLIFFEDCFVRSADKKAAEKAGTTPKKKGDHIDFFNGRLVMNDYYGFNSDEEVADRGDITSLRWFRNSKKIYFCPI